MFLSLADQGLVQVWIMSEVNWQSFFLSFLFFLYWGKRKVGHSSLKAPKKPNRSFWEKWNKIDKAVIYLCAYFYHKLLLYSSALKSYVYCLRKKSKFYFHPSFFFSVCFLYWPAETILCPHYICILTRSHSSLCIEKEDDSFLYIL